MLIFADSNRTTIHRRDWPEPQTKSVKWTLRIRHPTVATVELRGSRMFIATDDPTRDPSSVGAKSEPPDNISLLRSLASYLEHIVYKHFVPTGLRPQAYELVTISFHIDRNVVRDQMIIVSIAEFISS